MAHRMIWKKYSGPQKGRWTDIGPLPAPGPGEITIDVKAAGVNYADVLMVNGQYQDAPKPPGTPGYEIAGLVKAVGQGCSFQPGDRVASLTKFNGYSTEITVRENLAAKLPDSISYADGASLPVTGLTALVALEEMARVKKDDVVLIHSASGGVGQMAIQLCQIAQAKVIGIVSRESKKSYLEKKFPGISVVIDAGEDSYGEKIKAMGTGIDISLNPVGGRTITVDKDLMNPFAKLVVFGIARASGRGTWGLLSTVRPMLFSNPIGAMNKNIGYFGLNLLNLFGTEAEGMIQPNLTRFLDYFKEGRIQSMVEKTIAMPNAAEAHELLSARKAVGKLILTNE